MQGKAREAQARIAALRNDAKLDEQQKADQLRAYSYEIHDQLAASWIQINARLDLADAWLSRAEGQRAQQQQQAAPAAAPQPEPATEPTNSSGAAGGTFPAGDPRAAGAGSDAAAR
jgi:hypothetical protein